MATDQELIDQMLAEQGGSGEDEGILNAIKNDTIKSFRAAGFMLKLYKPTSEQEAKELRRRFAADAALLAASSITGGVAGAAMKGVGPVARAILGGALSFGAGSAAHAAVEGENVPLAAGTGALLGAGFGGLGAGVGAVRRAAKAGAEAFVGEAVPVVAPVARALSPRQLAVQQRTAALAEREAMDAVRTAPYRQTNAAAEAEIRNAQLQALYEKPTPSALVPDEVPDVFGQRPVGLNLSTFESAVAPDVAPFESAYRSPFTSARGAVTPAGVPVEEAPRVVAAAARGRDTRGRFIPREAVDKVAAKSTDLASAKKLTGEAGTIARDVNAELARIAALPMNERIAAMSALKGGAKPRLPSGQSRYRGPRMGARSRPAEDGVLEAVEAGASGEIVDLALNNSLTRRVLMKLGTKVEAFGAKRGQDWNIAAPLDKIYNDVANLARRTLVPVESALVKMGPAGAQLGTRMSSTIDRAMRLAADDVETIRDIAKLSLKQRINVAHVLHGDDVPMDSQVAALANTIRSRLDDVGMNAKSVELNVYTPRSGQVRPFALRENYYPLEYSPKTIAKYTRPGPEREFALQAIMRSEQSISRREAEAVLNRYLKPHLSEFRYGHLQMAREMALPGWEEDPLKVLPQYFMRARKRIEIAREFGAQDQAMYKLTQQMAKEGYDHKYALEAYRAFSDKEPLKLRNLAGATRTLNMLSLLSTTGLVQLGQHSNIIAMTGWKNYLQGMAVAFKRQPVSQEWAARTGSYMQELMQDLVPFGDRGLGAEWAKIIGLEPLDKANRIVAAFAGRFHADDIAAKYAKETAPKALAILERQLTQLRLSPAEVKAAGGVLTSAQRSIAGQQASLLTQFRGSVLDMPLAKHSSAGQFLYLFKNFAIQQTRFVARLVQDMKEGNYAPAIRYLTATGTLTAGTGYAVSTAKYGTTVGGVDIPGLLPADRAPDTAGLHKYLESMMLAGALGIAADGLRGMANGPEMFRAFILGPTANDAVGFIGRDVPELARGNPRQMMHDALKHTPLFGRRVAEYLVPLEE